MGQTINAQRKLIIIVGSECWQYMVIRFVNYFTRLSVDTFLKEQIPHMQVIKFQNIQNI